MNYNDNLATIDLLVTDRSAAGKLLVIFVLCTVTSTSQVAWYTLSITLSLEACEASTVTPTSISDLEYDIN